MAVIFKSTALPGRYSNFAGVYWVLPDSKQQRATNMEALKQTSYVKSIVTAQGKMDLERKGK